jgi:hypothetical protein
VSINPFVPSGEVLIGVARVLTITLTFVCVGPFTMLVVSLVMVLASLILFILALPLFIELYVHLHARYPDLYALWSHVAIQRFCFVVSMMVCWKLIDIVRGKTPAAGSLAPT